MSQSMDSIMTEIYELPRCYLDAADLSHLNTYLRACENMSSNYNIMDERHAFHTWVWRFLTNSTPGQTIVDTVTEAYGDSAFEAYFQLWFRYKNLLKEN